MARRHRRPARHAAPASSLPNNALRHRSLHCERLEDRRLLAVVTVDTEFDLVDFNDGMTSLREAIFATNTVPGADEIRFDFGHAGLETILLTHGQLAITDAVSIVGSGAGLLTIDGQLSSRLFNIGVAAGDVTFRGVTLTRGQTTGDNISLADVMNQTHSGGAIRSVSSGLLTLDQVDVMSNGTTGVYASGGALFVTGPLAINLSKVRGNIASGANSEGGGVAVIGAASITATTFSGNRAARGGGVSASGVLTIDSSTLNGNRAVGGPIALGGAVYAMGTLSVVNSTISTNAAQAVAAAQGAGIWTGGAATIAHSTIVANTASTLALTGVGSGGGIYGDQSVGETLTINHTIIGGNFTTEENGEVRFGSGSLVLRHSLIADNDGTNLNEAPIGWADANGNLIGGPLYGYIDPLFDGLEENGGPTRTHALLPGSPAVFAGDLALVPGAGSTPKFDQRGAPYSRRVGTRMAIGAVESSVTPIIVDSLADGSDGNFGPGELTLREALELANGRVGIDAVEFAPALFAAGPKTILLTHGDLKISQEIELRGPGSGLLTVDAKGNDKYPDREWQNGTEVFSIDDADRRVAFAATISGLTVTGAEEGGIVSRESLTLIDVVVRDNLAFSPGAGGIEAFNLTLIASQIVQNRSINSVGGIAVSGDVYIDRSVVSGNHSQSISWNAVGGVGIRPAGGQPSVNSEVIIVNSVISGNSSSGGGGVGGVRVDAENTSRPFYMANTLLSENRGNSVGGMQLTNLGDFTIYQTSIINNSSQYGPGGLSVGSGGFGNRTIDQSTISGNSSLRSGGGIAVVGNRALTIRRTTIHNNSGLNGGGIYSVGRITLDHSIVAGNIAEVGSDVLLGSAGTTFPVQGTLSSTFSLIGNASGTDLLEAPVSSPDDNGNIIGGPTHGVINPLLAPLAENGGPPLPGNARLLTHALLPGSPAIDAGDPTLVPGEGETPEFDQRGAPYARLAGQRVDIGAIERQEVGTALGADFNFNGVVDGGDFLAWQRGFGSSTGSFSAGDATEDGVVDGEDLDVWQGRFGDDGMPPAVATTAAISTGEAFAVQQQDAIRFELADAALQSFSILNRLDRSAIDLRSFNGLELSRDLRHASPRRNVERASDQSDMVCDAPKSQGHHRDECEAGRSISLELLDRSFAEGTWLDSELSKCKNGATWRDEEVGVSTRVPNLSSEQRRKS
jgi:predicted outer membrane repeat protein